MINIRKNGNGVVFADFWTGSEFMTRKLETDELEDIEIQEYIDFVEHRKTSKYKQDKDKYKSDKANNPDKIKSKV